MIRVGNKTTSKHLYLQTILRLKRAGGKVRKIDLAKELGYSKPTITNAIKRLCEEGLVAADQENGILLTEQGLLLAEKAAERNDVLNHFFRSIGADETVASENADRIGSLLSDELFELIRQNQKSRGIPE